MYSKATDTHQYLSTKSCHPKIQSKTNRVIEREKICSDNLLNDINYKKGLTEYKVHLTKPKHDEKEIDVKP